VEIETVKRLLDAGFVVVAAAVYRSAETEA
jgi:hypothetical protein